MIWSSLLSYISTCSLREMYLYLLRDDVMIYTFKFIDSTSSDYIMFRDNI